MARRVYRRTAEHRQQRPRFTTEGLCRWCGKAVPSGRKSWCSEACVEDFKVRNHPQALRAHLLARDGGVCHDCGLEAHLLRVAVVWLLQAIHPSSWRAYLDERGLSWLRVKTDRWKVRAWIETPTPESEYHASCVRMAWLAEAEAHGLGKFPSRTRWMSEECVGHTWEADHDTPLADGGDHGPAAVVTRCVPCHKAKTKAEAKRRAENRRKAEG